MTARLKQMERLQHLRGLQEKRREAELAKATGRLRAVEAQIVEERESAHRALSMARQAMIDGERPEMMMGERLQNVSVFAMRRLEKVKVSAVNVVEIAKEELVDSRRETEQAKLLADTVRQEIRREIERREQAVSDDRFAARLDWTRRKTALRMD